MDKMDKFKFVESVTTSTPGIGNMTITLPSKTIKSISIPSVQAEQHELKSSGKKRTFSTGAVRDSGEGKPQMELLPLDLLERVAILYGLGADKYGTNNWRLGQPQSAVLGSLLRHVTKYQMGMKDEDHLAAIVWNALSLMNSETYYADNPQVCDITDWFKDGKPNVNKSESIEDKLGGRYKENPVTKISLNGELYTPTLFQDGYFYYVKK